MGVDEDGSYGAVMITGTAFFGAMMMLAGGVYMWLSDKTFHKMVFQGTTTESPKNRCDRKRGLVRRFMSVIAFAAFAVVFAGYLLAEFKLGKVNTQDVHKNWLYFVAVAIGYALVAIIHAQFFWIKTTGRQLLLALFLGLSFVIYGVGQMAIHSNQRILLYSLALGAQAFYCFCIAWFSGDTGPLFHFRGWIVALPFLGALTLYAVFWMIGYPNAPNLSLVVFNARWKAQLPFLIADAIGLAGSVIAAAFFYLPRVSKKAGAVASAAAEAGAAAQSALLYGQDQGF